jgi:hypothetical protein
LTLVGMVLYAPYVMFAYIHHRYVSQREAQLLERLKPECVDVHLVDDHAGFTLFTCNHLVAQSRK